MDQEDKKDYEVAFLLKSEEHAKDVLKLLGQHGAEMVSEGPLRGIQLAYPIEKETQAYFGFFWVRLAPEEAKKLEDSLRTMNSVLRYLLIKRTLVTEVSSQKPATPADAARPTKKPARPIGEKPLVPLSNEALERKIEEILK